MLVQEEFKPDVEEDALIGLISAVVARLCQQDWRYCASFEVAGGHASLADAGKAEGL
jgi:hypothetical protein